MRLSLALLLFLAFVAPASAAPLTGDGGAWAQRQAMHVPGPSGPSIAVNVGAAPGSYADATGGAAIDASAIYLDNVCPNRGNVCLDPNSLRHELGHFFDARSMNDLDRKQMVYLLGYPYGTAWFNANRSSDNYCERIACPSERFADAYMVCSAGMRTRAHGRNTWGGASSYGYRPTRAQHHRVCDYIRDVAADAI